MASRLRMPIRCRALRVCGAAIDSAGVELHEEVPELRESVAPELDLQFGFVEAGIDPPPEPGQRMPRKPVRTRRTTLVQ